MPKKTRKKKTREYKERPKITISPADDPAEYARRYYHLVIKGRRRVPPKIKRKKRRKK